MNFSLELKFFISSHPVTSKQPHKIVQILLGHPVNIATQFIPVEIFLGKRKLQYSEEKNCYKKQFVRKMPLLLHAPENGKSKGA